VRQVYIVLIVGVLSLAAYVGLHASAVTQFSYAKESFTGQTAAITNATLFTPTTDGDYLIGVYAQLPLGSCSAEHYVVEPSITWSDNDTTGNTYTFSYATGLTASGSTPVTIHATAGNPVTLNVADVGDCASKQPYDVFVTIIGQ
jgi:hypothetical protein